MPGSRREYFDASRVKAKVAADRELFCLLVLGFAHDTQRSQAPDASRFTRLTGAFHLTVRACITHRAVLFQLAMRAACAVHAVAFQLALRAGVAVRALALYPSVRAGVAIHAVTFQLTVQTRNGFRAVLESLLPRQRRLFLFAGTDFFPHRSTRPLRPTLRACASPLRVKLVMISYFDHKHAIKRAVSGMAASTRYLLLS
jgi:hypothetical protein